VGKTTTCVNLAASLGAIKRHVLLIDLDPQSNATIGSGVTNSNLTTSLNDVLLHGVAINEIITTTKVGYDVVPAGATLTAATTKLLQQKTTRNIDYAKHYLLSVVTIDFILIDCPPA